MGTEYYLVKPSQKETFYLGKHFTCPEGIKNKADFIEYDCWNDFLWEFLRENSFYFDDLPLEVTKEALYKVYEWCSEDKIYFDNDCNDDSEWKDWKEFNSLEGVIKEVRKAKREFQIDNIQRYLEDLGITTTVFENPSYETALIGISSDERAVYDYNLMVDYLVEHDKMSIPEAEEFIEYNTIRALPYFPKAPVILMMDGSYE